MCRSADRTFCDFTGDDGEEMKKGVFHTNGFKPLEEVVRIVGKSEPDCDDCPFRKDCGPGCVYKEVRWYLEEYQDMLEDPGKMVEYLRQASIQRSKDLAKERKQKK